MLRDGGVGDRGCECSEILDEVCAYDKEVGCERLKSGIEKFEKSRI